MSSEHHARLPLVYTKRQMRKRHNKDGGGKQMKLRTKFASCGCLKHGTYTVKGNTTPELTVSIPKTKREQFQLGCPRCLTEARAARVV